MHVRKRMKRVQVREKEKFVSSRGIQGASWAALVVKNPPANAEDGRDTGSIPGLYSPWGHKESDTTEETQHSCRGIQNLQYLGLQ